MGRPSRRTQPRARSAHLVSNCTRLIRRPPALDRSPSAVSIRRQHARCTGRGCRGVLKLKAEEMCIYTGTAQRFPTHVLALIPYTMSAAFALVKNAIISPCCSPCGTS